MSRALSFKSIHEELQVLDLKRFQTDLTAISNRRFMYHPSGILILGDEDHLHPGRHLYRSHAEEYGFSNERMDLPPYDEFCRGWIGVGGSYKHGIIHFAPQITTQYLSHFNAAFDFIETALENGFTEKATLRAFCDQWEQTISHMLGRDKTKKPTLDSRIQNARIRESQNKAGEGTGRSSPDR